MKTLRVHLYFATGEETVKQFCFLGPLDLGVQLLAFWKSLVIWPRRVVAEFLP